MLLQASVTLNDSFFKHILPHPKDVSLSLQMSLTSTPPKSSESIFVSSYHQQCLSTKPSLDDSLRVDFKTLFSFIPSTSPTPIHFDLFIRSHSTQADSCLASAILIVPPAESPDAYHASAPLFGLSVPHFEVGLVSFVYHDLTSSASKAFIFDSIKKDKQIITMLSKSSLQFPKHVYMSLCDAIQEYCLQSIDKISAMRTGHECDGFDSLKSAHVGYLHLKRDLFIKKKRQIIAFLTSLKQTVESAGFDETMENITHRLVTCIDVDSGSVVDLHGMYTVYFDEALMDAAPIHSRTDASGQVTAIHIDKTFQSIALKKLKLAISQTITTISQSLASLDSLASSYMTYQKSITEYARHVRSVVTCVSNTCSLIHALICELRGYGLDVFVPMHQADCTGRASSLIADILTAIKCVQSENILQLKRMSLSAPTSNYHVNTSNVPSMEHTKVQVMCIVDKTHLLLDMLEPAQIQRDDAMVASNKSWSTELLVDPLTIKCISILVALFNRALDAFCRDDNNKSITHRLSVFKTVIWPFLVHAGFLVPFAAEQVHKFSQKGLLTIAQTLKELQHRLMFNVCSSSDDVPQGSVMYKCTDSFLVVTLAVYPLLAQCVIDASKTSGSQSQNIKIKPILIVSQETDRTLGLHKLDHTSDPLMPDRSYLGSNCRKGYQKVLATLNLSSLQTLQRYVEELMSFHKRLEANVPAYTTLQEAQSHQRLRIPWLLDENIQHLKSIVHAPLKTTNHSDTVFHTGTFKKDKEIQNAMTQMGHTVLLIDRIVRNVNSVLACRIKNLTVFQTCLMDIGPSIIKNDNEMVSNDSIFFGQELDAINEILGYT